MQIFDYTNFNKGKVVAVENYAGTGQCIGMYGKRLIHDGVSVHSNPDFIYADDFECEMILMCTGNWNSGNSNDNNWEWIIVPTREKAKEFVEYNMNKWGTSYSQELQDREKEKENKKVRKYLDENPEFEATLKCLEDHEKIHERNSFVKDVIGKLKKYGKLSDKQRDAVIKAVARDHEYHEKRKAEENEPKGNAPEGRVEVEGVIVSTKVVESFYGRVEKMLVKLTNNSKVWCSVPSNPFVEKGDEIKFKATFTVSDDDPSFAFGKRPIITEVKNV